MYTGLRPHRNCGDIHPRGGSDMLILDRGYSLAKLPRCFEGAEKFG